MAITKEELARRLRLAREAAGLTQEALASRIGLTRTSITNIERGSQHIPLHLLFAIAGAVGVEAATLLPSPRDAQSEGALSERLRRTVAEDQQGWVEHVLRAAAVAKELTNEPSRKPRTEAASRRGRLRSARARA